jgi:predicted DNA-binding protein (UPF0251 family)
MHDMVSKGRAVTVDQWVRCHRPELIPRGENHKSSKLTDSDVLEIRHLWATKVMNQPAMALKYGVGQDEISRIVHRKRWNHI